MRTVHFFYADLRPIALRKKRVIKEFIREIFLLEGKKLDTINYIFCSDNYLLEINRSYLKHDYYTDIITFDLSADESIIGEVYISVDRVTENSKIHGTPLNE